MSIAVTVTLTMTELTEKHTSVHHPASQYYPLTKKLKLNNKRYQAPSHLSQLGFLGGQRYSEPGDPSNSSATPPTSAIFSAQATSLYSVTMHLMSFNGGSLTYCVFVF